MKRIHNCVKIASLFVAATALAGIVFAGNCSAKQPNVVFILADDLGWADTTLYGHTRFYKTPNIERLAKRGMKFTHAYSASPLCSPTRSAILTGLSPARTGITAPNCHVAEVILKADTGERKAGPKAKVIMPKSVTRLSTDYSNLAKTLKKEGYATGHFGKWHLGPEPYSALQHGFDVDLPHHSGPGPAGSFVAPWKFKDFDHDPNIPDQHIEDRMALEAIAWMEKNRDRPFFLNYWMFSVHAPFDAKKKLIEKYRTQADPTNAQRSPTYAAMVESMDDAIGTLLDALDRLGLSDNTIIIFTADNGGNMYNTVDETTPTSNAPLRGGKATMYEGGTRVPAVVVMPGVTKESSVCNSPVQSEDYYPTLVEALGIVPSKEQKFDGKSFLDALKGKPFDRDAIFQYFPHGPKVPESLPPAVSVHLGKWKLIRVFHDGDKGEHRSLLYDLEKDIGETTDLSSQHPEMVQQLEIRIDDFLRETHAVLPIPNENYDAGKEDEPWQSLFNGSDFAGWKVVAFRDPAPAVIEEGVMVLRQRINTVEHTFVTTEKKYGDFILDLEVKDDPEFNSGILLRCSDAPAKASVRLNGYQVKIDNTKRAWTGGVFDDFGNGWKWLYDLKENPPGREAFKFNEWARFRIECIGPTIKVWVNGVPTCNLVDDKYREGYIAFKIHSVGDKPKATESVIRFRNIRILTKNTEKYARPMDLEARRASTGPGEYDKISP